MRLVVDPDGQLVVDYRAKLPGRGAWVHPDAACVAKLEAHPGILTRAFGAPPDTSGLGAEIRRQVEAAMLDGLSMAAAAGALVGGFDALEQAIREGRVGEVVLASDASVRTVGELRALTEGLPFTPIALDRQALGERVGRGPRAALGVTASRAASHLRKQLRRLRALG